MGNTVKYQLILKQRYKEKLKAQKQENLIM